MPNIFVGFFVCEMIGKFGDGSTDYNEISMIYAYFIILIFFLYLFRYLYVFYNLNKNQLSIIVKRAFYFRTNPIIRQTFIMTTLKLLLRLIRKSIFKV